MERFDWKECDLLGEVYYSRYPYAAEEQPERLFRKRDMLQHDLIFLALGQKIRGRHFL